MDRSEKICMYSAYFFVYVHIILGIIFFFMTYSMVPLIFSNSVSVCWLYTFWSRHRYLAHRREAEKLFNECEKRLGNGAPICELKEMLDKEIKWLIRH